MIEPVRLQEHQAQGRRVRAQSTKRSPHQGLRKAFPGYPLRLDPNANWSLQTSIAAPELDERCLEYYEDPTPGLEGMAELPNTAARWPPTWWSPPWTSSAATCAQQR
jgi:L-alanine-DL-glutamate epimerase-like enolase superfamily enzyme